MTNNFQTSISKRSDFCETLIFVFLNGVKNLYCQDSRVLRFFAIAQKDSLLRLCKGLILNSF